MANTARIHPARVMFVDRDLDCFRLRTYGHRASCPVCGERIRGASVAEVRVKLAVHDRDVHPEPAA